MAKNKDEKKIVEVEKSPEVEEEGEDEGIASMFGRLISQKLSSKKKRFAEVE